MKWSWDSFEWFGYYCAAMGRDARAGMIPPQGVTCPEASRVAQVGREGRRWAEAGG